jgi:predicted amidohydrolase
MSTARVAVAQMTSTSDITQNLSTCTQLAREAKAQGCTMLFLPENFSFIGTEPGEALKRGLAQDISQQRTSASSLLTSYQTLAREVGIWLSLGGMATIGPDPQHSYNTHVILDNQGQIREAYQKIHLFDVDVPNGPVLMESRFASPGNRSVVCEDTPIGNIGLMVCYDLRFSELSCQLAFEKGAHVLTYPSAFTRITGEAHWEVLLRARAIETQCYVIAAAQAGWHNEKRESYGHSMVIDPWGKVIAKLDDPLGTGIACCEIDQRRLDEVRTRMPISEHRSKGHSAYKTQS